MSKFTDEDELGFTGNAFIQYKNTDICIDFYCECGKQCHYDGYFAYLIECPSCGELWQLPPILIARKAVGADANQAMKPEPDEDTEEIITNG